MLAVPEKKERTRGIETFKRIKFEEIMILINQRGFSITNTLWIFYFKKLPCNTKLVHLFIVEISYSIAGHWHENEVYIQWWPLYWRIVGELLLPDLTGLCCIVTKVDGFRETFSTLAILQMWKLFIKLKFCSMRLSF